MKDLHNQEGWLCISRVEVASAQVGVLPHEQGIKQTVSVDVGLCLNTARAARTDALADTVDWAGVVRDVVEVVEARHYQLIETLTEHLASMLLQRYAAARRVRVEVRKHGCLPRGCAAVSLERSRAPAG